MAKVTERYMAKVTERYMAKATGTKGDSGHLDSSCVRSVRKTLGIWIGFAVKLHLYDLIRYSGEVMT